MSRFTKGPKLEKLLDHRKKWAVVEDFSYDVGEEGSGITVTVERGFVTDFGSIPWPFSWFISPYGLQGPAFIIHDWLYWLQSWPPRITGGTRDTLDVETMGMTRKEADLILLEAMGVLGRKLKGLRWLLYQITRYCIYAGVRVGGWYAWKQAPKQERFYYWINREDSWHTQT